MSLKNIVKVGRYYSGKYKFAQSEEDNEEFFSEALSTDEESFMGLEEFNRHLLNLWKDNDLHKLSVVAQNSKLPKSHLRALVHFSKMIAIPSMLKSLSENSGL